MWLINGCVFIQNLIKKSYYCKSYSFDIKDEKMREIRIPHLTTKDCIIKWKSRTYDSEKWVLVIFAESVITKLKIFDLLNISGWLTFQIIPNQNGEWYMLQYKLFLLLIKHNLHLIIHTRPWHFCTNWYASTQHQDNRFSVRCWMLFYNIMYSQTCL